ncbi:MAG: phosphodiester glycosidase family protein [Erysipelotrichaceae bacterium]|nr:phosphodiester glycosidase family protein [Erysipelotrichaceae bacterium]
MAKNWYQSVLKSIAVSVAAASLIACSSSGGGESGGSSDSQGGRKTVTVSEFTGVEQSDDMWIEHITGSTYEGWMMCVKNSDDITVEVNPYLGTGADAPELETYVEKFKAVGGINAGGFMDEGGTGNGSIPQGIVIHNGELLYGNPNVYQSIIGIDKDDKLVCTGGTGNDALKWGMKEAVTFGPVFISNYEDVFDRNYQNLAMLNPRTAIGQASDGTMLLLVLDGRGPSSFGAKYEDVIDIFRSYDAINAANLDGGNSTAMIYNGEYVNNTVSMYGSRNLPTVFLVKEGKGN